jgi:hypothetical protein
MGLHNFAAAEGLRAGTGMMLSRGGEPFMHWPPLLPILLAAGRGAGLSYPAAGLLVNLVAQGVLLYASSKLLLRLFGSPVLAAANLAVLALSPFNAADASTIHSEPLFLALVSACLLAFAGYLERPTRTRLAGAIAIAGLACLQRYVGVALVGTVSLLILLLPAAVPRAIRARRAVAFGALSVLPLVPWLVRNWLVGHSLTGKRFEATRGFAVNTAAVARTIAGWLTDDIGLPRIARTAALLLAAALFLVALARCERKALAVYLAFPAVYLATLIGVGSVSMVDEIGSRLVLPVHPFVWGALLLGLAEAARATTRIAGAALLAALLACESVELASLVRGYRWNGVGGLGVKSVAGAPLSEWLRTHPMQGEVYCNVPEIVLVAAGRLAKEADLRSLPRIVADAPEGAHVVWTRLFVRRPAAPDFSESHRSVARVFESPSGSVYEIGAAASGGR